MIWLIYALISVIAAGFQGIIHRKVMLTEDPYSYALLENVLTALIFIPLLYTEFVLPSSKIAWLLVIFSSIMWVFIAIIGFYAYKYAEASVKAIISQSRVLFLFIFSVILLSETITIEKIIGIFLIFCGLIILTYKPKIKFGTLKDKGVQLTLIGALLSAFVAIIDKKSLDYFTPGTYGFLVYLIPALIFIIFGRKHYHDIKKILKTKKIYLITVVFLGFLFYYFQLKAYSLAEVSQVFPITRLSALITVIGGIIFLRERKELGKKIISTLIILIGAILLSGNYHLI